MRKISFFMAVLIVLGILTIPVFAAGTSETPIYVANGATGTWQKGSNRTSSSSSPLSTSVKVWSYTGSASSCTANLYDFTSGSQVSGSSVTASVGTSNTSYSFYIASSHTFYVRGKASNGPTDGYASCYIP